MVVGLGVARLLSGFASVVQHPKHHGLYPIHLAWGAAVLLMLVHFWWWQFGLFKVEFWTFGKYLFTFAYAVTIFLLAALLFPDTLHAHRSYEEFFFERRGWFFGVLAMTYVLDFGDTAMKGVDYLISLGPEYLIRAPVVILLCIIASLTRNRLFHASFVTLKLGYHVSWIVRHF